MSFYDKLKRLESVSTVNYWAHRIGAQLSYMANLSRGKGNIYNERLEVALDYLMAKLDENHSIVKPDAQHVESMLADLKETAKSYKVYCISHAHIDMNWMWGYQETVSITVDTFRTVLNLMREYPEFTYAQSQASTYKIIEKHAPEMLSEIKKYVHEGRWELSASTWVETDKNMPNGESLSRHILYTKKYLSKLFDINPDTLRFDFEPDTFGHNANVPEILQNGGVDYYYHCRGYDGPNDIYRWHSKSGAEILVHRDPNWYNGEISLRCFVDVPLFCDKNNLDIYLRVYGVGDHGGGPTRRDIECIIDCASFPLYPDIKFGTYAEYFKGLEKFRSSLPVVDHELNFVFTGCYTTQTRIKLSNRISEDRLYDSEMLSAAASALAGASYKNNLYGKAWENVLFNHFHDILPGSGIIETREYALGLFQDTLACANTNANTAMFEIGNNIDTSAVKFDDFRQSNAEGGGVGFAICHESGHQFPQTERGRGRVRVLHLFNTTMYDRNEPVEVTVWDYPYDLGRVFICDSAGNEIPFQFTNGGSGYWGHTFIKLLIEANIPAFGYESYIIDCKNYDSIPGYVNPSDRADHFGDIPVILENDYIKAVFDPCTMAINELYDKYTKEFIVTPERPSAIFRLIMENPRFGMTSWRVGPYMSIDDLNSKSHIVRVTDYRYEPLRSYVSYEIGFASSKLNVTATLYKGSKYIKFDVDVDWHERGSGSGIPQLNFYAPVNYTAKNYKYDIPFGTIERGDIVHDVPGNSFIRVESGKLKSLFIVTDSKYGFRGTNNSGAVTLIRSATEPDPYPEYGRHHIKLGLGVCCNDCQIKFATLFNHAISFSSGTGHSGKLPMRGQLGAIAGDPMDLPVKVSAVKTSEDGNGYIIRLSEYKGIGGKVDLKLFASPKYAALVDITEKHVLENCEISGNNVSFDIKPYSIATLYIK